MTIGAQTQVFCPGDEFGTMLPQAAPYPVAVATVFPFIVDRGSSAVGWLRFAPT
jgi:hypothetical protein